MLSRLVAGMPEATHAVFSLTGNGTLTPALRSAGAVILNVEGGAIGARALPLLGRGIANFRPDVIQGWMYHGNFAALLAKAARPRAQLFWNIRQSLADKRLTSMRERFIIRLQGALSYFPAAIIYNSEAGALDHEYMGFRRSRRIIIPNGFDANVFKPDIEARKKVRQELGITDDQLALGLIARFDPWKNHAGFMEMAERLIDRYPSIVFVLAGKGVDWSNKALGGLIGSERLRQRLFLLGDRRDVHAINAALDVACNVSHGEGFPNAVGEAMACAVPCMITPVGASAELLGECGVVAPSPSPDDLYRGICRLVDMTPADRAALGARARHRIVENYSIRAVASQYSSLYHDNM